VYWRTARSRAAGRGRFFLSPPASRSCRHGSTGRTAGAGRPFSSPRPTVKAARALRAAGTRGGTTDQLSELTVAGAGAEELKGGLGTVAAHGLVHEVHQRTLRQDQIRRNTRPVGIRPWALTPWLPRLRCRALPSPAVGRLPRGLMHHQSLPPESAGVSEPTCARTYERAF
jgi:hypothetical protein